MKIIQLSSQEIKISYSPASERIFIGDIFKIADSRIGLLAQVYEMAVQSESPALNIASLKILFSLQQNNWKNWDGEIPSVEASLEKITRDELLKQFNILNVEKPVNIGYLYQYSGVKFAPDVSMLKNSCVIFADKQEEKQNLISLFASELLNYGQKIVILDFTGEYSDVETTKIKAGVDFKLPLNVKGLDRIYSSKFEGASAESQAIIEDVFIEVREYAKTCEEGFISFSSFKSVVDSTYEQSGITQLVLLKNRLLKYEQSGIFADNEQEIDALKVALKNDNLIVVDLSEILVDWQKDFVDNIISLNIEKNHQEFYLVFNITSENCDVQLLNKLFVKGFKSGIIPLLTSGYLTAFIESLLNYAKNLFLFNPVIKLPDSFSEIFSYISKLKEQEFIICGEITKYVPIFANFLPSIVAELPVEAQKYSQEEEPMFYSQKTEEIFPQEGMAESSSVPLAYEERAIYNKETPPAMSLQEKVPLGDSDIADEYDEDFLDLVEEASENEGEYIEFKDEDDDFSFEDEEEAPVSQVNDNERQNEIIKDVDELYIMPKEEVQNSSLRKKIPVYSADYSDEKTEFVFDIEEGDIVRHQKYGTGVVKKIISYGNKKLCSIHFDEVGRRLLDPELAVIEKVH
ncbi:MAG: hypothetical protein WC197_02150 [Candidatus Gastranaerophilaceae bacterium]|jgi:hypothetical protein